MGPSSFIFLILEELLYIDLRPGQTCHSKDGGSAYSIDVGELGWQYGLKSHGTATNWCTGREGPVNCMTVISAWWRSNMPFQRLSGRWNYYINRWRQEVRQFGDRRVWREDAVEKNSNQLSGPPGLRLSNPGERKRTLKAIRVGRSICCSSVQSPTPSHTQTFQIKWEVYFSNVVSLVVFIVSLLLLC